MEECSWSCRDLLHITTQKLDHHFDFYTYMDDFLLYHYTYMHDLLF